MALYDGSMYNQVTSMLFESQVHVATENFQRRHENIPKPFECDVCQRTFARKSQVVQHYRTHTGEKPFACEVCGKRFSHSQVCKEHVRIHTGQKPYLCDICGNHFSTSSRLRKHKEKHETLSKKICFICGEIFTRTQFFDAHLNLHFPEDSVTNDDQGMNGESQQEPDKVKNSEATDILTAAMEGAILTENDLAVNGTGMLFENDDVETPNSTNEVSQPQHSTNVPLQIQSPANNNSMCKLCGEAFTNRESFIDHRLAHLNVTAKYSCKICDRKFLSQEILDEHVKCHVGEKPFLCHICGYRAQNKSRYNYHMKLHRIGKPYCCEICGKRFSSKALLSEHCRIHSSIKHYSCEYCLKRFTQNATLRSHILHYHKRPEKMHCCQHCDYKAVRKSDLNKHLRRRHPPGGSKKFICNVCEREFYYNYMLLKHMKSHEKHFKCEKCNKAFHYKRELDGHHKLHKVEMIHFNFNAINGWKIVTMNFEAGNRKTEKVITPKETDKNDTVTEEPAISAQAHEQPSVSEPVPKDPEPLRQAFICKTCIKPFPDKKSLDAHVKTFKGKKPFKCGHCGRYFHIKVCAQKHILSHVESSEAEDYEA